MKEIILELLACNKEVMLKKFSQDLERLSIAWNKTFVQYKEKAKMNKFGCLMKNLET